MLDFQTLNLVFLLILITNIIVFIVFYRCSSLTFKDFSFWVFAYAFRMLGLIIYLINYELQLNILIFFQFIFIYTSVNATIFGVNQLVNRNIHFKYAYLIILYMLTFSLYFISPLSMSQIIATLSVFNMIGFGIAAYYALHPDIKIKKKFVNYLAMVIMLLMITNSVRLGTVLFGAQNSFTDRHWLNSSLLMTTIGIFQLLTFTIIYVIFGKHQHRFYELESDLEKQKIINLSEKKFKLLFEQMPLGIAVNKVILDENNKMVNYEFLEVNKNYEKHTTLKAKDLIGKTLLDIIPEDNDIWLKKYEAVYKYQKVISFNEYSKPLNSYFNIVAYPIDDEQFVVIVNNITEMMNQDKALQFLATHDQMTGLKNRQEFIKELNTFKNIIGIKTFIMMLDINGLIIFNDAFGNDIGDFIIKSTAKSIVDYTKSEHNVYRVGGDSFAIILTNTNENIEHYIKVLKEKIEKIQYKDINVNVTFSYVEANWDINVKDNISELEKRLVANKAKAEYSHYSNRITMILETLTEKYEDEKSHSNRVKSLCVRIGEKLGLDKEELKTLSLAGHLHDIGKIAIPEEILHKPGRLNNEEYEIVKTHAEIGYRILNAVAEYQDVAIATRHHHERYDGNGYPDKLKGENIPLFSRIISVVDAYEAMTSNRVYRKSLGETFALEELKKCSGTQFDPKIVEIFIKNYKEIIQNHDAN